VATVGPWPTLLPVALAAMDDELTLEELDSRRVSGDVPDKRVSAAGYMVCSSHILETMRPFPLTSTDSPRNDDVAVDE